ncbi:MAG: selenide, water dikinase SelD [Planctomycetes bacterium RBG_16_64_10]|nr:MAG: selenide, water dikinase SelD [Planctomycetes bacterium RBG_16_64_10]
MVRDLPEFDDPNLIVGPDRFGDAGVYRLRDDLLIVQSVDFFPPLVDDPYVFGQIAAANSMSDIFAMGGRPVTALNIVGFPDNELELAVLSTILQGGAERLRCAGATLVGGHSVRDAEIKYGLAVTGVVRPDELLTNHQARPGDALVLTKALGTGFVTTAHKAGRCPDAVLADAVASMVALNAGSRDAALAVQSHAATDVTGFGLAGHSTEMALASHVTIELDLARLPLLPGADRLAEAGVNATRASRSNREFSTPQMRLDDRLDPIRLCFLFEAETSGGLLVSVPAPRAEELVRRARTAGADQAAVVGRIVERHDVALVVQA